MAITGLAVSDWLGERKFQSLLFSDPLGIPVLTWGCVCVCVTGLDPHVRDTGERGRMKHDIPLFCCCSLCLSLTIPEEAIGRHTHRDTQRETQTHTQTHIHTQRERERERERERGESSWGWSCRLSSDPSPPTPLKVYRDTCRMNTKIRTCAQFLQKAEEEAGCNISRLSTLSSASWSQSSLEITAATQICVAGRDR